MRGMYALYDVLLLWFTLMIVVQSVQQTMQPKRTLYLVKIAHDEHFRYYRNGGPGGGRSSLTEGCRVIFKVGLCLNVADKTQYLGEYDMMDYCDKRCLPNSYNNNIYSFSTTALP